jgi:NAD(P)H dehydrogenase (quinone)
MATTYAAEARHRDLQVEVRDLYAMDFDPRLSASELPGADGSLPADLLRERELLADTAVFAFFYPFWFNAPPAILKGYMERVFGLGFAYEPVAGGTKPLLGGRKMLVVSSSGAPREWVEGTGAWEAERQIFDTHFAAVCGLELIDHLHFGSILPNTRSDFVEACADRVRSAVQKNF